MKFQINPRCVFPFTAVMGQEQVKKALLLNVINPAIGGVLISGEKGTAKSTLVRGLAAILEDMDVVDLPLNITEDRLVGTIDLEKAIQEGQKCFDPGLFKQAHGNLLYVDEVNLLGDAIVNCLLSVSAFKENRVEREGISHVHPSDFVLVGSMNPEEGFLRPQFLDRFGLYVESKGSEDPLERMEVMRRRLDFEADELGYQNIWKEASDALAKRLHDARTCLEQVELSETALEKIAEMVQIHYCAGNRAEIVLTETVRALAAYDLRMEVLPEDLQEAALLALPHRMRDMPRQEEMSQDQPPPSEEDQQEQQEQQEEMQEPSQQDSETSEERESDQKDDFQGQEEMPPSDTEEKEEEMQEEPPHRDESQNTETIDEPEEMYVIKELNIQVQDRKKREGSGRRSRTVTSSARGRYIRYTFPKGRLRDMAFDATLRAAAPFQKMRKEEGVALKVRKSDFREKVREMRTGSTILFVVDASGSMGARQRMKAVKGAVLSLLNDAYQKRDKVGLVAFRKDSAELMLGITRSVDLAQKCLRTLPTGGKTPLSAGLLKGYEILKAAKAKDPHTVPYMIVVSDGRANVSMNDGKAVDEALEIADLIAADGIRALVIDTEKDFIKLELAAKLAEVMKADYCKLEDLREGEIETLVRKMA